jgi:type II secretory pathway predicted ATPase ExeA
MYEAHFGLAGRPFLAAALADRYCPVRSIETARRVLSRAIDRCEGVGIVLGAAGTGKSLLCRVLLEQFRERWKGVLLSGGRLGSRKALLRALLYELGLAIRGLEEDELWLCLAEQFSQGSLLESGLLLVVDEAHLLSPRLLEELRCITDFTVHGALCVRLVLAGCPELEQKLAHPRLASLQQRISARCLLEPLGGEEVRAYVQAQLALVGGGGNTLFEDAALDAVARVSEGIQRLINQVCDHALILAYADGAERVSAGHVEQAWSDLQQLPLLSVHRAESGGQQEGGVIEFGGLEEETRPEVCTLEFPHQAASLSLGGLSEEALSRHLAEAHAAPALSLAVPEQEQQEEGAWDPFGGPYAEEEIVLDRFANYDDALFRTLPQVASPEGRQLGCLLQSSVGSLTGPHLVVTAPPEPEESVLPQIVVEDDPSGEYSGCGWGRTEGVQRVEYTELFSRLRG